MTTIPLSSPSPLSPPIRLRPPARLNFVSVGFTLKVWRNWLTERFYQLSKPLNLRPRMRANRIIWIFGSGRSGTTWLMESLQRAYNLHSVMEFFHPRNPSLIRDELKDVSKYVLDPTELGFTSEYISRVTKLEFSNVWINRTNPTVSIRPRHGVVLKDVGNRLLHAAAFTSVDNAIEPVVILRQPSNVLKSIITSNEIWQHADMFSVELVEKDLRHNFELISDFARKSLERCIAQISAGNQRNLQVQIALWCSNNMIALESLQTNPKTKVVIYEKLAQGGSASDEYLKALFGEFKRAPMLQKRSRTDWNRAPAKLDADAQNAIAETLTVFGLGPFTIPGQPHLLDLQALADDYQKPRSARLAPQLLR